MKLPVSITVLFTGLIRPEDETIEKLQRLSDWKRRGVIDQVVFTTWLGVLDQHPAVTTLLDEIGALVVELEEPKLLWHGHFLHQYKSLHFGLMACSEGAFVLKIRSDKMLLDDHHEQFCIDLRNGKIDLRPDVPPGWPQDLLTYRICSSVVIPSLPFFFNDICFFGLREDLLKLGSLDLSIDLFFPRINPEQIFFSAPFLRRFPRLFQYFRVNPGIIHHNASLARSAKVMMASSPFYTQTTITFLIVIASYFRVGFPLSASGVERAEAPTWSELFAFDEAPDPRLIISAEMSNVHIVDGQYVIDFLSQLSAGEVEGISKDLYAQCRSWEWQMQPGFVTIGLDKEAARFADDFMRLTGGELIYPGTQAKGDRIRLPYWPLDVRQIP